jgi:S1-C subfamily serine protease
VPDAIQRMAVVLYVIGGPSRAIGIDHCGTITATLASGLQFLLDTTGRRESALVLVEFYRRGSGWRLAATGQGYTTGIAGIERALGITLDVPDARGGVPDTDGDYGGPPRPPAGSSGGGSGFAVAPLLLVTNHHVIDGARQLRVQAGHSQSEARVVAEDPINDIALLAMEQPAQAIARFRADLDVDLGEDLVVAGFPLQGLLGQGPQISGGNVSALTGLRGDATILQFTCPIGSGSSGGPIMDGHGLIVGLVRSVLRTDLDHAPVAQNINFGVKAAVVRSFLHAAGVAPAVAPAGPPVARAELARQARAFLYRIEVGY